jgi:NAD(P)-dependent dehydrogenase (short-subunit alcohol dehydrogenase family)
MKMIITGAANGIGRAVASLAAKSNDACELFLIDRDAEGLDSTAHEAEAMGCRVIPFTADLSKPDACVDSIRSALFALGGIDALISNAGIVRSAPLSELDVETFDLLFQTNTRPTWLLGKAAYPALKQSRGCIVATASIAGEHATPPLATYSASKAALIMLVRQMAIEWGPDGIRCNCVSPGPTYTRLTEGAFNDEDDPAQLRNRLRREAAVPLRKLGQPDEVAEAILFLASSKASHITGIDMAVDGGLTIALMPATGGGQGHGH